MFAKPQPATCDLQRISQCAAWACPALAALLGEYRYTSIATGCMGGPHPR